MKKALFGCVCVAIMVMISSAWAGAGETEPKAGQPKPMKPGLVVIDIQNEFLPYMADQDKKMALEEINAAIWLFRERGLPIFRVYHTDLTWGPKPDSPGFQFPASVMVKEDDPKVIKNYPSAFKKTELEQLVRARDCNTLFLCGLSATGCVLATYHGAADLDFNVFLVKNALLSPDAAHTDVIEDICDSVGFTTLKVMLDSAQK